MHDYVQLGAEFNQDSNLRVDFEMLESFCMKELQKKPEILFSEETKTVEYFVFTENLGKKLALIQEPPKLSIVSAELPEDASKWIEKIRKKSLPEVQRLTKSLLSASADYQSKGNLSLFDLCLQLGWEQDFPQAITSLQIFKELNLTHLEKLNEHLEILTSAAKLDDIDIEFCEIDDDVLERFNEKLDDMENEDILKLKNELMKFINRTLVEQDPSKLEGTNLIYYVELDAGEDLDSDSWEGLELKNLKHFLEVLEEKAQE